jgi:outer membrane protein
MKQFSLILNILLLAAVGVLYYFHFSADKKPVAKTADTFTSSASPLKDSCATGHLIAFIEIDSIYDNVDYIRQKNKEIESQQTSASNFLQSEAMKLENEKNEFLKKGNSVTQAEYETFEKAYIEKQKALEEKRQSQVQSLTSNRNQAMEGIQKNLRTFLDEFNGDRRYSYIFATGTGLEYMLYKDSAHNITPEVIKGLNEYFRKKGK